MHAINYLNLLILLLASASYQGKKAASPNGTKRTCPPRPTLGRPSLKEKSLPVELHRAVYAGDLAKLKTLVTSENILLRDHDNDTLAHLAARVGNVAMLRFLANKEKELIEYRGKNGETPLIAATRRSQKSVVKFLLEESGADPNAHVPPNEPLIANGSEEEATRYGESALHVAAAGGNLGIVKMLLLYGANISARDKESHATPLHQAAFDGHLEVVKYLMEWRKSAGGTTTPISGLSRRALDNDDDDDDLVWAKDVNGDLPIHYAAYAKRTTIVRYLAGVDPRQLTLHGAHSQTILHIAAGSNDPGTLHELLNHYWPNVNALANYDDRDPPKGTRPSVTALMLGSMNGHELIVRMLLGAGANDSIADWGGKLPIHRAAKNGYAHIVELLLDSSPQSVNARDSQLRTPLHYAVVESHRGVVTLLLKRGASLSAAAIWRDDDDNTAKKTTATPLTVAARVGDLSIFKELIECGANIEQRDAKGRLPMHIGAQHGHIAVVDEILTRDQCQLEWSASSADGGDVERTALSFALNANQSEMVDYLLRKGANAEAKSRYSSSARGGGIKPTATPLIFSTRTGNNAMLVETLLRNGADPNAVDEYGSTALHYAAMLNTTHPAQLLIHYGAKGGLENVYGETPMELVFSNFFHQREQFALLVGNDQLPLHRAVAKENVALVRSSVPFLPTRLNQRNAHGETALEMAVRLGKVNMASALVEAGVRADTANADGNTLLHTAASVSNATIRRQLVELINRELGTEAPPLLQFRSKNTTSEMARAKSGRLLQQGSTGSSPLCEHLLLHRQNYTSGSDRGPAALSHCGKPPAGNNPRKNTKPSLPVELQQALCIGDLPKLKALVSRENILLRDEFNSTMALLAAQRGDIETLRYLLSLERSLVNAKGVADYTPLHVAAKSGHTEIVELLLDAGADVNALAKYGGDATGRGFTSTMKHSNAEASASATPLHLAAREGCVESAKVLLQHRANLTASDWHGRTPLHWAAMIGHLDVVELLVLFASANAGSRHRDAALFARDADGDLPIHDATFGAKADVVAHLADVDRRQLEAHGLSNLTALHIAAKNNDSATLRVILALRPNLDALGNYANDPDGTQPAVTPLMLAAVEGHEMHVRVLLEAGANDSVADLRGDAAIHKASARGHNGVVKALLDRSPGSVNFTGERSFTPLHFAITNQRYETVLLLLERGADLSARATNWDDPIEAAPLGTPILFAARVGGDPKIFQALVESGARVDQADLQHGLFPIHFAALSGHIGVVKELLARDKCQLEWREGSFGHTPLTAAITANRNHMVEYLLGEGADAEAKSHYANDPLGYSPSASPLILATRNVNDEVVEMLLLHGANPNEVDRFGNTPLHQSLNMSFLNPNSSSRIIDLLVRHGALVGTEDVSGRTSTEVAFTLDPDGDHFRLLVTHDSLPLHRAVVKENAAFLRKAIHYLPTRLCRRNQQGETALEMAVRLGKVELAGAMLEAGLRVDDMVNGQGNTLLHIAASHSNGTIRAQLMEMIVRDAGAEVLPTLITWRDTVG